MMFCLKQRHLIRGIRLFSNSSGIFTVDNRSLVLPSKVPIHLEYDLHLPHDKHVEGHGNKGCLILLHGLFGSKQNYKSVGKHLCKKLDMPVYALDLRNHGDSLHCEPFDYMSMSKDVEFFMNEHNLEDITIVGHSMGAKVAMCVSLLDSKRENNAQKIKRMISVDNSPVCKPLGLNFNRNLQGMYELEISNSILKTDKKWRVKGMDFLKNYESDPKTRLFLIANFINRVTKYNFSNKDVNYEDEYAHFKIPVINMYLKDEISKIGEFPHKELENLKFMKSSLFLKGAKSDFITKDTLPKIDYYFPSYKLIEFNTDHWVISEQPVKFMETVETFIRLT